MSLLENPVAVATVIADRPPHRSVRALLAHTALTSDGYGRSGVKGSFMTHTDTTPTGNASAGCIVLPLKDRQNLAQGSRGQKFPVSLGSGRRVKPRRFEAAALARKGVRGGDQSCSRGLTAAL